MKEGSTLSFNALVIDLVTELKELPKQRSTPRAFVSPVCSIALIDELNE